MSDSQAACATVGMNITRTKLVVFVIAGGMAGLSGALYGGMSRTVSFSQFSFVSSLVLFVAVALAGITVLSGAVQAGLGVALLPLIATHIPSVSGFTYILFGVGIIAVGRNPYGLGLAYTYLGEWWEARRARAAAARGRCPAHPALVSPQGVLRWLIPRSPSRTSRCASVACRPSMPSRSTSPPARSTG